MHVRMRSMYPLRRILTSTQNLSLYYHIIILSYIILSYYHIIILSYYHIIILSYYHIIILLYYHIIIFRVTEIFTYFINCLSRMR